jgi:hypothetical protein
MSGITILFHAHDKIWENRSIPLKERIESCGLIDLLIIQCLRSSL